jgi:hypothetical protein
MVVPVVVGSVLMVKDQMVPPVRLIALPLQQLK